MAVGHLGHDDITEKRKAKADIYFNYNRLIIVGKAFNFRVSMITSSGIRFKNTWI